MKYNIYWWVMYKVFKKRRPIPDDFFDFDVLMEISDVAKEELLRK